MWNLGNRDFILLVSVISGCAILCNVWGPLVALTTTIVLVICAWLTSLVADDTPLSPHATIALDRLEEGGREIKAFLAYSYARLRRYVGDLGDEFVRLYRVHVVARMAQRRRSTYQLSSESYPSSRNCSGFNLVEGLSPIARGTYRSDGNGSNLENRPYVEEDTIISGHASSFGKVTSTPLVPWRKEDSRNGDAFGARHSGANKSPWIKSMSIPENHTLSRGEDTIYSPQGSPWGTSISPKMRSRAAGVKTVQTVAGPLLASTRYNIDPKVYSDVTSPGLTTRLTKYATEANSKLTHQSQYGTGQFPRVNLNSSPTPLINTKIGKMRVPVMVRVAPPENTRYSPTERQKILSNICHAESATAPSVVQVLREISLKRHASREDVTFELAKKQRTDGMFSDGLENLEEMTQKRVRDESSRSEEEISPQNKSLRPAKRSKMPSCCDILSSLSSSINVSSGVKRKAVDISRSGTPDVGKHFKSLDSSYGDGLSSTNLSRSMSETTKSNKRALNESDRSRSIDLHSPNKKLLESVPMKGILKSPPGGKVVDKAGGDVRDNDRGVENREVIITREAPSVKQHAPVKLTDKLFMKAEPQNIDKLKTLIEEHGSIKPRFTTDDTDEIKKSDIVNMRQTSMKTRLKSMFDAISGKATSKINPEVVIQAEEANSPTSSPSTASLSSSTLTTNVNTSPIATSAVVPIIGKTKSNTTPAKHVTFHFDSTESSATTPSTLTAEAPMTKNHPTSSASESNETKNAESTAVVEKPASTTSLFQSFDTSITTTQAAPAYFLGPTSLDSGSTTTASITLSPTTKTTSSPQSSMTTAVTASPPKLNSTQLFNASSTSPAVFENHSVPAKTTFSPLPTFTVPAQSAENTPKSSGSAFSFGTVVTTTPASSQSNSWQLSFTTSTESQRRSDLQGSASESKTLGSTASPGIFGSGSTTTSPPSAFTGTTSSSFASGAAPATTSMFSFASNAPSTNMDKKEFTFGAPAASSAQSTSTVGSVVTSQPASTSTAVTAPPAIGAFTFSSSSSAPTKNNSLFGSVTTASSTSSSGFQAAASTTAAFTFGSNATTTSKSGFSFGSNTAPAPAPTPSSTASSISFGSTNTTAIPLFGSPSTISATTTASNSTPQSPFGAPAATSATTTAVNQSSLFGAPTTSSVGFATATTSPSFGTTGSQSSFVSSTNTFGAPKTMDTLAFGPSVSSPTAFAATSTPSGLFSGANTISSANATPTTAASAFGTSSFGQTKPATAFGASTTSSFASGGNPGNSLFGSQPTTQSAFGTATPAAATSMFGSSSNPAQSFGTPTTAPPPFGATNTSTTSFGTVSTTAPSFGTLNTSTPAFGLQSSTAGTSGNQSSTGSAFSSAVPVFGAVTTTAPPAFGTSVTSPSAFGASAPSGFGTTASPPPAFSSGSGSSFTGFGAGTNATLSFVSQPNPGGSSFGAPNSAASAFGGGNSNAAGSFTFVSQPTAQQGQQQQQQSAVFAFGASSAAPANNAPSGSAPFQFGASAPQTGGFNFTGAPSAPAINFSKDGAAGGSFTTPALGANSFSAPTTGGMFSIGSGSTGSRRSRRRQR